MGFGSKSPHIVQAEEVVTPAVAKQAESGDRSSAQQEDTRARLRGIRGTYHRYADNNNGDGLSSKLGQ